MTTEEKQNGKLLLKEKICNFDVPMDEVAYTDENKDYEPIDVVCSMMDKAKQDKAAEDEERKKDLAKKMQEERDNAAAAQKAADEKAKKYEEEKKVINARYMRKRSKRNATIMTFCLCISSAVFGYIVAGIIIWTIFKPPVWMFVGVMGVIGMIDTFLHTYLYRFIREEIYRK